MQYSVELFLQRIRDMEFKSRLYKATTYILKKKAKKIKNIHTSKCEAVLCQKAYETHLSFMILHTFYLSSTLI